MNILFLSLADISSIYERGVYTDLLREFIKHNHYVFIVSPSERRCGNNTKIIREQEAQILKVKTGNITKTNLIEKGISTLLFEHQIYTAIRKYFQNIKFDIVIYATPPITYLKILKRMKKQHGAVCYLLLKDIFPQNAVDLCMLNNKGFVYKYFKHKEKKLYEISDFIGCMSQANVDYIINHNPGLENIVHISPNCIEPTEIKPNKDKRTATRKTYGIPANSLVFLYGGNLGKPQDIPFIIECLKQNTNKKDIYFIICGTGTEYYRLEQYIFEHKPENVKLINGLPKKEYGQLLFASDIGLIFLDNRFTIPNFPSRLLDYMDNYMPVIACTDNNTDIGKVIHEGEFGWWCLSDNPDEFTKIIDEIEKDEIIIKGRNARKFLENNYTSVISYNTIMSVVIS